jgi:hypothetical protein
MSKFTKKHPALADAGDTILSILSGSFALLAIVAVWIKSIVNKKKG